MTVFFCVIHGIDKGIGTAKVHASWLLVSYLHFIGLEEMLDLLMAEILM
jgi:hypothetical protein